MVQKGIRGGICHALNQFEKTNNDYMKDYDKESSYIMHLDINNLYGWAMLQKLPVSSFKWIGKTF